MPSAATLTPRADPTEDAHLEALWADNSSVLRVGVARRTMDTYKPIHARVMLEVRAATPLPAPVPAHVLRALPPTPYMSSLTRPADIRVLGSRLDLLTPPALDAGQRFAERFEELRSRLRLPVQKYARLLGTTRRTLYHWFETDRPQELAVDRFDLLAGLVSELELHLSAGEIQRLLDPEEIGSLGALLLEEDDAAVAERVRVLTEEARRPRTAIRLDTLSGGTADEAPEATADDLRAAFAAFGTPRRAVASARPSEPAELDY